ncbi:septum formation family protein [Streptomyces mirabilis]|uniref:septum formation family protein n=1 Tax=Streptomyces mirabilis TaxID=68239 RepID=UPI00364051AC
MKPYGDAVGLTRALHPGDCVNAVWTKGKFVGLPGLGIAVNCTTDQHDGQVLNTDAASSLGDTQKSSDSRCRQLLASTVNAMADARSYALPPSKQGWDAGVHSSACLLFNKTTALASNVGPFRKFGEQDPVELSAIGDCYKNTSSNSYLAKCDAPHDGQAAGFIKAPEGMTYQTANANSDSLCRTKYGSKYANYGLVGNTPVADDWKLGFRYVQCDVGAADTSVVTQAPSTQPTSG